MPRVSVTDLEIHYGPVVAVDGVSFDAAEGAVTAVLGPNGAGKTSVIECCEGFRPATAGTVRVGDLDPFSQHRRLTEQVGVMLQDGGLAPAMRVREALELQASYYRDPLPVDELIDRTGLTNRRRATTRTLSGGERQRLSLALAIVGRPTVVFLDEPTAGVDLDGRRLIHQLIDELRRDGVTVVLTTHDLAEVERLADHIVILDRGRVVIAGSPHTLLAAREHEVVRFRADPGLDTADLGRRLGVDVTETPAGHYTVAAPPTPERVAALARWFADADLLVGSIQAGRQGLEELFLSLTESGGPTGAAGE